GLDLLSWFRLLRYRAVLSRGWLPSRLWNSRCNARHGLGRAAVFRLLGQGEGSCRMLAALEHVDFFGLLLDGTQSKPVCQSSDIHHSRGCIEWALQQNRNLWANFCRSAS